MPRGRPLAGVHWVKANTAPSIFGWACDAKSKCPTGGKNRRAFTGQSFAARAAKNHSDRHGCKAHVVGVA